MEPFRQILSRVSRSPTIYWAALKNDNPRGDCGRPSTVGLPPQKGVSSMCLAQLLLNGEDVLLYLGLLTVNVFCFGRLASSVEFILFCSIWLFGSNSFICFL